MGPLRYAHSEGHTDVCYTDSGENLVTCGREGDVRVWCGVDDMNVRDICAGDQAWAVYHKKANIYVATDTNIVQAYTFPQLDIDGIITRFRAPVTQIDVSPDGSTLAAGSCDMEIHVVDMMSMTSKTLSGHRAPVRSVSLDPHLDYLASTGCDGTAIVWKLESSKPVMEWNFLNKSNSFESLTCVCRLHFQPSGRHLAIPVSTSIKIFERDTWKEMNSFSIESNESAFSVVRFSKCNKYLAGGTEKGDLFIWNISNKEVLNKYATLQDSPITSIAWHPRSTEILFCNKKGQIGDLESRIKTASQKETTENEELTDVADIPLGEPYFEDDEDNENAISLEKIKAASGFGEDTSDTKSEADDKESVSVAPVSTEPQIPMTELQETFQPTSTPTHLQQRFMVWNSVGIVRQFSADNLEEIDIEFHDSSVHHGFRLGNPQGYNMAALTQQALVLASPQRSNHSSLFRCIMLKAWDAQKDWEVSLGVEEAIAVAAGLSWVAVVTNVGAVHIFSVDGTQTDIITIPGPLITLTGSGSFLSLFFYSAQGVENDHFISYLKVFIDPGTKLASQVCQQTLSLSTKSKLNWVGHTDEGSLATLDTEGILRVFYNKLWRPICALEDRPKGKFDHYFVIGLSETTHTIRCILCKGSYYPPAVPKPLVSEIEWQIPLFELDSEKGKLEEVMMRSIITLPHLDLIEDPEESEEAKKAVEKSISVTIMKLFALACQSGLEGRAVSLCYSMPSVEVVRLASKYAAKLGRHQLAGRVTNIASEMVLPKPKPAFKREDIDISAGNTVNKVSHDEGSQDMFSDNESSQKTKEKENLIMLMKKKTSVNVAPIPQKIKRNINPFKKTATSDSMDKMPRISYIDWYKENVSTLKEQNPLLKDTEIATLGLKKYRQDMEKYEKESAPEVNEESEHSPPKKALQEKQSMSESIDIVAATPDEIIEKKKRKNSNAEGGAKKKIASSAASKLKSFAFAKKS